LIGGSFKVATEFAEALAANGRRVSYVCGTRDPNPPNPTWERGVELWRYPYPRRSALHVLNLLSHVWQTRRLIRNLIRTGPVAFINGHTPLQFRGAALAAGKQAKLVYSVHSPFADELQAGWNASRLSLKQKLALTVAEQIERLNCTRATAVHCASQFTRELLSQKYGEEVARKAAVCPNWVDISQFAPSTRFDGRRELLGFPWNSCQPIFLTVRRLEPRMGLEQLLEAARQLVQRGYAFRLLIGGAGSLRAKLAELLPEMGLQRHVFLLGRIPHAELPACFAAADCVVLPSRALECFGLTILESYAAGTPVIGTPVGAIPELIRNVGQEWLTRGTDSRDLAERMAAFLEGALTWDAATLRGFAEGWDIGAGVCKLTRLCD
jgi:glycosyltransferase involved in cell wall biosynthesis